MLEQAQNASILAKQAMEFGMTNQRKGGQERARRLSPEDRKRIASAGAQARWAKADPSRGSLPKAVCGSTDEPVRIGDAKIPCYVLEDETRVLTVAGVSDGIGLGRELIN